MNSIQTIPLMKTMCRGCLSVDRNLSEIIDKQSLKIFIGFFEDRVDIVEPLLLCWECEAVMGRICKFISQVRTAHSNIVNFMLDQSLELSPMSKLRTAVDNEIKELKYNDMLLELDSGHAFEHDTEPLAFVKLEEAPDDGMEMEYNGEMCEGFINKECQPDMEICISKKERVKKDKSTRKSKRKEDAEDFNDSDDEPLRAIKEAESGTEEKTKKRKRKKDKEEVKTKVRTKREKPPGVVHNPRVTRMLKRLNVDPDQLEMVVLSWEEVEEERQRAVISETFTRHDYQCKDCVLGFNYRFKLDNHMKKHDQSSGPELCDVCRIRCKDSHALCAHRRRHRVRWRCVQCGAAWSRAGVAADHVAREHGAPAPTHVCSVCGHRAPTLGKLRNHIKSHAERQKCELCEKTFRDRASLRAHLFVHNGEKEYECPRCGKRFLFKKAMQIHLVTHDASAHVYCYQCDMNFKNQMSFNQHMKYSLKHVDPSKLKYACHLCDKKFMKAKRLEEHNLAVHLKATPIQCTAPGCNFACASRPVLRTHTRVRHRQVRPKRDHVCDICGKAYTSAGGLRGHLRAHSGERPLRCARCPAAFGYEAALYNHNRLVHRGPKVPAPAPLVDSGVALPDDDATAWSSNPAKTRIAPDAPT